MKQTGLIRITLGLLLTLGAVEHQPDAPLLLQLSTAIIGLMLMAWAAADINRAADNTINSLKGR
jgi:hypothetical protein